MNFIIYLMTDNDNTRKSITLGVCYCCGHLFGIHTHESFISYCCFEDSEQYRLPCKQYNTKEKANEECDLCKISDLEKKNEIASRLLYSVILQVLEERKIAYLTLYSNKVIVSTVNKIRNNELLDKNTTYFKLKDGTFIMIIDLRDVD